MRKLSPPEIRPAPRAWMLGVLIVALAAAALACGNVPQAPDSRATVAAFYTTITAQAASGSPFPTRAVTVGPIGGVTEAPQQGSPTSRPQATTGPTATPPERREGLGEFATIPRCQSNVELEIDGSGEDWEEVGAGLLTIEEPFFGEEEWQGRDDLSGEAYLCYDTNALYLLVVVVDDIHVQNETGLTSWKGDEIEFFFDADLRGDFFDATYNADDTQLGLNPGNFDSIAPNAILYRPGLEPLGQDRLLLASRRAINTGGNYTLEAAIPWTLLRNIPQSGTLYGLCVAVSDNDHVEVSQQDSMSSNCTELVTPDPTTFATVQFE